MDVKLIWDEVNLEADVGFANGDLIGDDTLETAAIIGLFADRRANADDKLPDPNDTDRRGWIGDFFTPDIVAKVQAGLPAPLAPTDPWGSRLWELGREGQTQAVLDDANAFAAEGLAFFLTNNIASKVHVAARYPSRGVLYLPVKIDAPNPAFAGSYGYAWAAEAEAA